MPFLLDNIPLRQHLWAMLPHANVTFTQQLLPGVEGVLGLRVPDVRALARRIVRESRWEDFLTSFQPELMEERMLYGLVLSAIPVTDVEAYLSRLDCFVPFINSWSVCDVFSLAGGRAFWAQHRERLWGYLLRHMNSEEEYTVRFGVVVAMKHFIDQEYVLRLLEVYSSIKHEGYYVRMAVAWAVAECFICQPEATLPLLRSERLPQWTHNKSIQKACESLRVSPADKQMLRRLKRKR